MNETLLFIVIVLISIAIFIIARKIIPEKRIIIRVCCGLAFLMWLILGHEMKYPFVGIIFILIVSAIYDDYKELRHKKQKSF